MKSKMDFCWIVNTYVLKFLLLIAGWSWLPEGLHHSSTSSDQWQDEGYHTNWRRVFRGRCFQISFTGWEALQVSGWKIHQKKNLCSRKDFKCYFGPSKCQGGCSIMQIHFNGKNRQRVKSKSLNFVTCISIWNANLEAKASVQCVLMKFSLVPVYKRNFLAG